MAGMFDDLIPDAPASAREPVVTAEVLGRPDLVLAPSYKPAPAAEPAKPISFDDLIPAKPKRSLADNVTGAMANFNRGLGVGDEMAAGFQTAGNIFSGQTPISDVVPDFKRSMAGQRAVEDSYATEHPNAAALARGTGMATTMAVPGAPIAATTRAMGAASGAVAAGLTGAAYAAADRGTPAERLQAASSTAANPFVLGLGAAGGAMAAPRQAPRPQTVSPQDTLKDAGVFLTPGQQAGGLVKTAEDLGARAPILGTAIRGARARSVESLNRAFANRALEPLGEVVPAAVKTGHDAVAYVADRLGKEYDAAAAMVPSVARDAEFDTALANIGKQVSELPSDVGAQFKSILENRLDSRLKGDPITGTQLRKIQSEISSVAAKRASSNDGAQQDLGHMLEDVSDQLKALLGRANPEAGQKIATANDGWSNFVRLRNAASRSNTGIATPGQFSTAVRVTDKSVGKGNVAKGQAVGQDLSGAASAVMPDAYGNPGTADAASAMALLGLTAANPVKGVATAAGLTAAATPYFLMGRKVVSSLPANASRRALQAADAELARLAANDPAVSALRRQVAGRLSRASGIAGGSQASQNIYARPAPGASTR